MRKILPFLSFCILTISLNAQYFSENFNNGTLGQFTSVDNDGDGNEWNPADAGVDDSGAAISNSWLGGTILTPDNLLTSSAIDLTNAGSVLSLEFVVANVETTNNWWEEYYDVIITSTDDVATIVSTTPEFGEALPEGGVFLSRSVDVSAYAGSTIYVTFRHHNCTDENFLILDNVVLREVLSDDLALSSVDIDPIVLAGSVTVSGTVTNEGYNEVTSFDVNWNDGNGDNTETFNMTVAPGQTMNFSHATTLTTVAGTDYNIDVCVSAAGDLNSANNCTTRLASCASQEGTRLPLMEVFTSSTCPPCFTLATSGFGGGGLGQYLKDANANAETGADLAVISYQVNWPEPGDHAWNSEVETRRAYYGVSGAPTLFIDAQISGVPSDVTNAAAVPTYVDIDATHIITGNDVVVDVAVNPYASFPNTSLQIAILDDQYAAGGAADDFTNGETEFHHVFRKHLPNANGTTVNLVGGQGYSTTESYTTSEVPSGFPSQGSFETHIGSEREVVVFLQGANGNILNAAVSVLETSSVNDLGGKEFNVFPNPSNGLTTIEIEDNTKAFYTVYTLSGQVLKTGNMEGTTTLDLSDLNQGFYMISLKDENNNLGVSKISIVK